MAAVCKHGLDEGDCIIDECKQVTRAHWDYLLKRPSGHSGWCCPGCRQRIEALEQRVQELDLLCNQLRRLG